MPTPAQLEGALRVMNPALSAELREHDQDDSYQLVVGTKLTASAHIDGRSFENPQYVVQQLKELVRMVEQEAQRVGKVEEAIERRDRQWETKMLMALLLSGHPREQALEIIKDMKEQMK